MSRASSELGLEREALSEMDRAAIRVSVMDLQIMMTTINTNSCMTSIGEFWSGMADKGYAG